MAQTLATKVYMLEKSQEAKIDSLRATIQKELADIFGVEQPLWLLTCIEKEETKKDDPTMGFIIGHAPMSGMRKLVGSLRKHVAGLVVSECLKDAEAGNVEAKDIVHSALLARVLDVIDDSDDERDNIKTAIIKQSYE